MSFLTYDGSYTGWTCLNCYPIRKTKIDQQKMIDGISKPTRYFAKKDKNGHLDVVFALSHEGCAVQWSYDKPLWLPLTPSLKLGKRVLGNPELERLDQHEMERFFVFAVRPRNFSVEYRARNRWDGWVLVGLLCWPVILLWFIGEEFLHWTGGSVILMGLVWFPILSVIWLTDPLSEALVKLELRWHRWRKRPAQLKQINTLQNPQPKFEHHGANPTQEASLKSTKKMPEDRFKELAVMANELARKGAEHNLRLRTEEHLARAAQNRTQQQNTHEPKGQTGDKAEMRFFLVNRTTPALEMEAGFRLILGIDGIWRDVEPSEIFADNSSSEVSEKVFRSKVSALGCYMPDLV